MTAKNVIKWIFITIVLAILAIDILGFWKYKLDGTSYIIATSSDTIVDGEVSQSGVLNPDKTDEKFDDSNIDYIELSSSDFWAGEKLFIINIEEAPGQNKYTIQGLLYMPYTITTQEYNDINYRGESIEVFGIEYTKDKIQSNNLMLKSSDADAESLYIKYDSTIKKYVMKDSTTDYNVYKSTEKYVTTTVVSSLPFIVQKNNKSEKLTVQDVAESHNKEKPPIDQITINYSTLEFSKKGEIVRITELNL